jgi:hypothetical protein
MFFHLVPNEYTPGSDLSSGLGMDLEGQQLLRVHVIEGAEVGQSGEYGRLVRVVLSDEAPQVPDQSLLKSLQSLRSQSLKDLEHKNHSRMLDLVPILFSDHHASCMSL